MHYSDKDSSSSRIRQIILDDISKNGGYLAKNLSSVEIALAVFDVFDEMDKIVFCGKDQDYTFKYLNNIKENINSSLAYAYGLAKSRDLNNEDYNVVVVVNDETIFNETYLDTIRAIGENKAKMIIILNDTDGHINGLTWKLVSNVMNNESYNNFKNKVKKTINNEKIINDIHNFKDNIKRNLLDKELFSQFNIDYYGTFDGHDIDKLKSILKVVSKKDYPCLIHCVSESGKGYKYAINNELYDYVDRFDLKTGKPFIEKSLEYTATQEYISLSLIKKLKKDNNILLACANYAEYDLLNVKSAFSNRCYPLLNEYYDSFEFLRGLSSNNHIFVTIKSSNFSKVYTSVNNFEKNLTILINVDDRKYLKLITNLGNCIVAYPSSLNQFDYLIDNADKFEKPLIILYEKEYLKNDENFNINLGHFEKITNNDIEEISIFNFGSKNIKIKQIIEENNLNYTLYDYAFLNPIDYETLDKALENSKYVFINEDLYNINLYKYLNDKKTNAKVIKIKVDKLKYMFEEILNYVKES